MHVLTLVVQQKQFSLEMQTEVSHLSSVNRFHLSYFPILINFERNAKNLVHTRISKHESHQIHPVITSYQFVSQSTVAIHPIILVNQGQQSF